MALVASVLTLMYLFFLLSLVITGLVFLTNISDHKDVIPGFNNTMYTFLYAGLWIVIGITAVEFILAVLAFGVIFKTYQMPETVIVEPVKLTNPKSHRVLAKKSEKRSQSR